MKIRITGRRKLPKAQVGFNQSCPEGQMPDPNDSTKCIDDPDYIPMVGITPTKSMVETAARQKYDQHPNKETHASFNEAGEPLDPNTGKPMEIPMVNINLPLSRKERREARGNEPCPPEYYNPITKKCNDPNKKGSFLDKVYFANEAILNPLMNTFGLIGSQIEQKRTGLAGERKRRILDLNENSLPITQTRMGNFTHVGDSGYFDPRNTGFKSEGMATNPFYSTVGRYMAYGGENNNKTMKIRIISGPNQKMAYGGQSAYALNLGHRDVYAPMNKNPYDKSSRTIGPVPRDQANIEAERGETVYGDINGDGQNEHMNIGGKRHTEGGTPLKVPEGSFIFSDTKKMVIKDEGILRIFGMKAKKGGYTPAEIAKKYDVNKFRAVLEDPHSDVIQKRTAERMIENYEAKLGYLALIQEEKKGFPQGIPEIAEKVLETPLGQEIAGEYLQQQQEMMQQQGGGGQEQQMPQEGMPPMEGGMPQQGMPEEMMEGPQGQQAPPQEMMEQQMMPPMQRYGGGIGYYAQGGYIPEDIGMMAYGGYMPIQSYAVGGDTSGDPTLYNKYSKARIEKQGNITIIKYPDGTITTNFGQALKIKYPNGETEMVDSKDYVVNIEKDSKGVVATMGDGSKKAYFSNGRAQYVYPDGRTRTMGTVVNGVEQWEDEEETAPTATASTNTAPTRTQPRATNSQADPNDPYPNFNPWTGDVNSGKKNASKYSKEEWIDKLNALGYDGDWTNEDVQTFLYGIKEIKPKIDALHKKYGMPSAGRIDGKIGIRWDDVLDIATSTPPAPVITKTPPPIDDTPPPVITKTPPAIGGPVFQCLNGVVTEVAEADKVAGQTYYASKTDADAACKPQDSTFEEKTPDDYVPGKSNIPYGRTRQDVRNIGTADYNASLIKRFVAQRMANVNPQVPPFVARDPRLDIATRQAQFNMINNMLQQYGAPQAYMANSSLAAGRTGEGAAQDIANVNDYNVTGFNARALQNATVANQYALLNAQSSLASRQDDQSNESKYLKALGQGADRSAAARNQADTNAASLYGLSATSPYFYYNPWDQALRFNSDEGRAAYFNNLKNPDAYTQTEADRRYALYKDYTSKGMPSRDAIALINGSSKGYTQDYDYDQEPKKNKTVTKTPIQTPKYGGYVMNNPYLK